MIIFSSESLMYCLPEAFVLWQKHWEETEALYRKHEMRPNIDQFYKLEAGGLSRYFTARDDGKLVGHLYYIVHVGRHTSKPEATEDFFYILPEYRKGFNALKLIRFAVQSLKDEGVEAIGMSSKLTSGRDIDPLLKRAGFRHVANFYVYEG